MSNQVRIKMGELPLRARNLSPGEASKVFGGCTGAGQICGQFASPCCPGLTCKGTTATAFGFTLPYQVLACG
jgi:hypothetical protein